MNNNYDVREHPENERFSASVHNCETQNKIVLIYFTSLLFLCVCHYHYALSTRKEKPPKMHNQVIWVLPFTQFHFVLLFFKTFLPNSCSSGIIHPLLTLLVVSHCYWFHHQSTCLKMEHQKIYITKYSFFQVQSSDFTASKTFHHYSLREHVLPDQGVWFADMQGIWPGNKYQGQSFLCLLPSVQWQG